MKLVNLGDSLMQLSADLLALLIRRLELRPQHLLVDGDLLDALLHCLHSNIGQITIECVAATTG